MSLLQNLQKRGFQVAGGNTLESGLTIKKPKTKQHDAVNVIDDNPLTISGTIYNVGEKDQYGTCSVYMIPNRIGIPDNCPYAALSDSGNVVALGTQRQNNPDSKKETVLHLFSSGVVLVNCPIICIDFSTNKAGPGGKDVELNELTPGRQVEFYQCLPYCRRTNPQQRIKASKIVYNSTKVTMLNQKRVIFRALRDSKLAQQALALMYARRAGVTSKRLFEITVQDCKAVHHLINNVLQQYDTHEIKGPMGTEVVLRDDVKAYLTELKGGLEAYSVQTYESHVKQTDPSLSSVGIWSIHKMGTYHVPLVPLFAFDEFSGLDLSAMVELSTDPDHAALTMEQIEQSPPPAIGCNVSAIAIMEKNAAGGVDTLLPYWKDDSTGSCRVLHPWSIIARLAGVIKNEFGIYSPLLPMVVSELWSRTNQVFVIDEMEAISRSHVEGRDVVSNYQPALETSFGAKKSCISWDVENVADVREAIAKYGVKVSKELVKEFACDSFGSTIAGAGEMFNAEHYEDKANGKRKKLVEIKPPSLLTNGFFCVNGKAGLSFEAPLHQLPEGSTGEIEFRAIFRGCAQRIEDEEFVYDKDCEDAVRAIAQSRDAAQKTVAFFAIAIPAANRVGAAPAPEASEKPQEASTEKVKIQSKDAADLDQESDGDDATSSIFGK
jgi:hypothetical protein